MKRLSAAVSRAALVSLSPSSHLHLRQRGKRVDRPAFPIRWRGHRGRGNEGDARKRVGSDRAGVVISAAVAAPTTAPARPPGPHDFAGLQHGVGGPGKGAGLGGALQAMREGQGVDAVSGKAMAPGENTHTPSLAPPPASHLLIAPAAAVVLGQLAVGPPLFGGGLQVVRGAVRHGAVCVCGVWWTAGDATPLLQKEVTSEERLVNG